jgi:hypothetical protein
MVCIFIHAIRVFLDQPSQIPRHPSVLPDLTPAGIPPSAPAGLNSDSSGTFDP